MMLSETPPFWWRRRSAPALLLAPAARIYGSVARRRMDKGERADVGLPTLCIGNYTVGGGGKTPTAMAVARAAAASGYRPGFVSRGHGRQTREALLVDLEHHGVAQVGDEPLLLATIAPTAVATDRKLAAELLKRQGIDFLIMDDGFQSARLAVDYALIVVDARRGIGNGAVIPAGPLRAPLVDQIRHTDALAVVGRGRGGDAVIRATARGNTPIFEASLVPAHGERFRGAKVVAFAGIADPMKFFATLQDLGAEIMEAHGFPDHHVFRREEMDELSASAWRHGAQLVTTRKDAVRLETGGVQQKLFREECEVLDVELVFEPASVADRIVRDTARAFRLRCHPAATALRRP